MIVTVDPVTKDRNGRTIATIFVDGVNVNKEMVRQGHCWVYRRYVKDDAYFDLGTEARKAKAGLWSLPEASRVPPREWRKRSH